MLGRFIQPDSIIPDAYSSQALNGYSYVLGNPLRYVDSADYSATERDNYDDDEATISSDDAQHAANDGLRGEGAASSKLPSFLSDIVNGLQCSSVTYPGTSDLSLGWGIQSCVY